MLYHIYYFNLPFTLKKKKKSIIKLFLPASFVFRVTRLNKQAVLFYPEEGKIQGSLKYYVVKFQGYGFDSEISFSSKAPFLVGGICIFL